MNKDYLQMVAFGLKEVIKNIFWEPFYVQLNEIVFIDAQPNQKVKLITYGAGFFCFWNNW